MSARSVNTPVDATTAELRDERGRSSAGDGERIAISGSVELAATFEGRLDRSCVVLLHGGGQTRHSWTRVARKLHAAGYASVRFDARGHGDSAWATDRDYSPEAHLRDLQAVLALIQVERVALIGASMGGVNALLFSAASSTNVAAVVLVDIVLRSKARSGRRIMEFMTGNRAGFSTVSEAAHARETLYPYGSKRRPDRAALARSLRRRGDGRLHWHWDPDLFGLEGQEREPDFLSLGPTIAGRVAAPVLLLRGDKSEVVDDEGVAHLRSIVPQLEERMIANAGHMMAGDDNEIFDGALTAFLGRHMPLGGPDQRPGAQSL